MKYDKINNLFSKNEGMVGLSNNIPYAIRDFGSHFCAYIALPKNNKIDENDIPCNGGITYHKENDKYEIFGWDYFHCWNLEEDISLEKVMSDVNEVTDFLSKRIPYEDIKKIEVKEWQ